MKNNQNSTKSNHNTKITRQINLGANQSLPSKIGIARWRHLLVFLESSFESGKSSGNSRRWFSHELFTTTSTEASWRFSIRRENEHVREHIVSDELFAVSHLRVFYVRLMRQSRFIVWKSENVSIWYRVTFYGVLFMFEWINMEIGLLNFKTFIISLLYPFCLTNWF